MVIDVRCFELSERRLYQASTRTSGQALQQIRRAWNLLGVLDEMPCPLLAFSCAIQFIPIRQNHIGRRRCSAAAVDCGLSGRSTRAGNE